MTALELQRERMAERLDNIEVESMTIPGLMYKRKELSDAFDLVRDETNWKNPIKKIVQFEQEPGKTLGDFATLVRDSIIFFTGSTPKVSGMGNYRLLFQADGYYLAIGA